MAATESANTCGPDIRDHRFPRELGCTRYFKRDLNGSAHLLPQWKPNGDLRDLSDRGASKLEGILK
jgi:hypothetical protein